MVTFIANIIKAFNTEPVRARIRISGRRTKKASNIRTHIKRQLLVRLGLGGAIISIVLSLAVFINERHQISLQVIDKTRQGATRFNAQIENILNQPGLTNRDKLQEKLEILYIAARRLQETGHFVYIGIYNLKGIRLAVVSDNDYPANAQVQLTMKSYARLMRRGSKSEARIRQINGAPHIHLTVPLLNSSGLIAAHAEAVYAISDKTVDEIESHMIQAVLTVIAIVMGTTALLYPVIILLINRLSRLTTNLLDANLETLRVLGSAIAKRDSETDLHNYRVTIYAVRLAEAFGRDAKSIRGLIKGAFLHDVGKIGISDSILLKPGKLSNAEISMMKRHVQHGVDIIKGSDWLYDAAEVVGYHHEQFNGGGYPFGLQGGQIPFNARIFAIADVFDALTSRRPYKEPYSLEKTLEMLNNMRGSHFDPELLDTFISIAGALYDDLARGDAGAAHTELDVIIRSYFSKGIGELFRSSAAARR